MTEQDIKEKYISILKKNGFRWNKDTNSWYRDDGYDIRKSNGEYQIINWDGDLLYTNDVCTVVGWLALQGLIIVYC